MIFIGERKRERESVCKVGSAAAAKEDIQCKRNINPSTCERVFESERASVILWNECDKSIVIARVKQESVFCNCVLI